MFLKSLHRSPWSSLPVLPGPELTDQSLEGAEPASDVGDTRLNGVGVTAEEAAGP